MTRKASLSVTTSEVLDSVNLGSTTVSGPDGNPAAAVLGGRGSFEVEVEVAGQGGLGSIPRAICFIELSVEDMYSLAMFECFQPK